MIHINQTKLKGIDLLSLKTNYRTDGSEVLAIDVQNDSSCVVSMNLNELCGPKIAEIQRKFCMSNSLFCHVPYVGYFLTVNHLILAHLICIFAVRITITRKKMLINM